MSQLINAVFENGVFKPLEPLDIKEQEKVAIKIIFADEWQKRFDNIINRIHTRSVRYSSEEIENDISHVINEVRNQHL